MANLFGDQFLKAGLVTKKQVKKINQHKYQKAKKQRRRNEEIIDSNKIRARKLAAEKMAKDKALNEKIKQRAEQKAVTAQIKQLIQVNQKPQTNNKNSQDDIAYNFVDQQQIQKIYVSKIVQQQLSDGLLAIVTLNATYKLVPTAVAEKIKLRDEKYVILLNDKQNEIEEDDPYADYKIPDNLMW